MANASTEDDLNQTAVLRGMHVRIPNDHILLAKRLASRDGITLAEYVDQLIMADVRDKADVARAELQAWKRQAQEELRAVEAALADLSSH
jgi:hypothetical protein